MRCVSFLSAATISGAMSLFCSTTRARNVPRSCVASADNPSSLLKVSSSVDHPDADLDETKPLQRHVGGLAINEPRAKDAEQAQADEQHGKRNGGKAKCLLEDSHPGFRCSFQVKEWLVPNERWAGLRVLFAKKIPHNPLGSAGTKGKKPVAWRRVYVPWFLRQLVNRSIVMSAHVAALSGLRCLAAAAKDRSRFQGKILSKSFTNRWLP